MLETIKQYSKYIKSGFIILVLISVFSVLYHQLTTIDYKKTVALFREMDTMAFIMIIAIGLFAVLTLSLYDIVLARVLRLHIPIKKLLIRSYITNAFNNMMGFGGAIGAGLRLYNYESYNQDKPLGKAVTSMLFAMYTGLSFYCLIIVAGNFSSVALPGKLYYSFYFIAAFALYLPVYLLLSYFKPISRTLRFFGFKLTLASLMDWTAAGFVLYAILHGLDIEISLKAFLTLFVVAAVSGIISLLPGGIGAFDLVVMLSLQAIGVTEERAFLAVLLYRIAYYFFPFITALALSAVEYKDSAKNYIDDQKWLTPAVETSSFVRSLFQNIRPYYANAALATLCFVTSLTYYFNHFLIIYDAIDSKQYFFHFILLILNISASLILLVSSTGLLHGTMRALLMSMIATVLLLVTAALSYGTVITYVWLIALLALLYMKFRKPNVVKRSLTPFRLFMSLLLIVMAGAINFYLTIILLEIHPHVKTRFDTQVGGLLIWCAVLFFILLGVVITYYYSKKYSNALATQATEEDVKAIIETHGGNYVSHLAFSGDKRFFVNEEKDAFVMYQSTYNAFIVLGDPIGNEAHFDALLDAFYDQVDFLGIDLMFYQTRETFLPLYHAYGNTIFKLGEEALIDLEPFTLSGKKQRAFRATMNKAEKEGYTFEVVQPPFDDIFSELKYVSDIWLGDKKEMNFSVGAMKLHYLNQAPIGIIKDDTHKIVAFTTFMPTHHNSTLSVDLIRWLPSELPMMDIMYLHMMTYAKGQGYHYFNMGMATLSNVGQSKHSFLRERLAGQVFENFNNMYSFQGLRKYKQKFNPDWQPRYLIYRKYSSLLWNIIRITSTINSKKFNH